MDGPAPFLLFVLAVVAIVRFTWQKYLKRKLWNWWHQRRHRKQWQIGFKSLQSRDFDAAYALYLELSHCVNCVPSDFPHMYMGLCRQLQGDYRAALVAYDEAVRIDSSSPMALSMLANLLARAPDETLRDGPRASELAKQASTLLADEDWPALAILAGAQAECGDFPAALETYRRDLQFMPESERTIRLCSLEQLERGEPLRMNPELDQSRILDT